jgi:hypothetical protein
MCPHDVISLRLPLPEIQPSTSIAPSLSSKHILQVTTSSIIKPQNGGNSDVNLGKGLSCSLAPIDLLIALLCFALLCIMLCRLSILFLINNNQFFCVCYNIIVLIFV